MDQPIREISPVAGRCEAPQPSGYRHRLYTKSRSRVPIVNVSDAPTGDTAAVVCCDTCHSAGIRPRAKRFGRDRVATLWANKTKPEGDWVSDVGKPVAESWRPAAMPSQYLLPR